MENNAIAVIKPDIQGLEELYAKVEALNSVFAQASDLMEEIQDMKLTVIPQAELLTDDSHSKGIPLHLN